MVVAAVQTKALWYFSRGSGAVAMVLLTAVLVLGVAQLLGARSRLITRLVVTGLHKNLSLVALVFLALHIATSIVDGYVALRWFDAFVPFTATYRPVWVGLGAVAVDLAIAVIVTSFVRVRLGYRTWRFVHWLTYAIWPVALVHALGTGSDVRSPWLQGTILVAAVAAIAAAASRVARRRPARRLASAAAFGAVAVVPLTVGAWAWQGPLRDGWPNHPEVATIAAPIAAGSTSTFTGRFVKAVSTSGQPAIEITGSLDANPSNVVMVLRGSQTGTGLSVEDGRLSIGSAADPTEWNGPLGPSPDGRIRARLTDADGAAMKVVVDVRLQADGTASVTLTGEKP